MWSIVFLVYIFLVSLVCAKTSRLKQMVARKMDDESKSCLPTDHEGLCVNRSFGSIVSSEDECQEGCSYLAEHRWRNYGTGYSYSNADSFTLTDGANCYCCVNSEDSFLKLSTSGDGSLFLSKVEECKYKSPDTWVPVAANKDCPYALSRGLDFYNIQKNGASKKIQLYTGRIIIGGKNVSPEECFDKCLLDSVKSKATVVAIQWIPERSEDHNVIHENNECFCYPMVTGQNTVYSKLWEDVDASNALFYYNTCDAKELGMLNHKIDSKCDT